MCQVLIQFFLFTFQHLLSHAAPRPFVCVRCDAGFVTKIQLESHLQLHEAAWRKEICRNNNNNNNNSNNSNFKTIVWQQP